MLSDTVLIHTLFAYPTSEHIIAKTCQEILDQESIEVQQNQTSLGQDRVFVFQQKREIIQQSKPIKTNLLNSNQNARAQKVAPSQEETQK